MPQEIYGGAQWNPGSAAGYTKGRTSMQAVVCHYTVGRNSTGIGLDGIFHFLVSRDGHIQQFAEASALCWHAGEANGVGPGIEIEFLDEPEGIFTDAARDATSGLIHWLSDHWGIPLDYYDGARIPPSAMRGFVAHRSIQQTEGHSDYWPRQDWDRMVAGAGPEPQEEDRMQPELMADEQGVVWVYDANAHTKTRVDGPATLNALTSVWALHGVSTKIADSGAARDILKGAVEIR